MSSVGRIRTSTTVPAAAQAPAGEKPQVSAPFELAKPTATASTDGASLLSALRSGALDRQGYVEARVAQAVAHLSALPPHEQESIRQALRERCESDPVLRDLIAKVSGG
jgi:hypothetical protein